ncbi:MAG: hypothetical protein Q8Q09_20020 [Deltaproteobacteria bacterium]|nr:hypothetical protein [Deltaproteobacteria bacterium]
MANRQAICRRLVAGLSFACVSSVMTSASADWPMFRHDRSRTASTTTHANLARPVRAWSQYMGGRVDSDDIYARC